MVTGRRRVLVALLAVAGSVTVAFAAGAPLLGGHGEKSLPAAAHAAVHGATRAAHATVAGGRLLFVGASYSIGLGATERAAGYPSLLADQMHRAFSVDAVSGTGFQNPGRDRSGTFAERIARVPISPPPRVVIIQGGRDDTHYPITAEYTAALDTIRLAQNRFTSAQVVVLGPIPASLPVSARVGAIRAAIGRACATAHAGFIDPITGRWITPANVRSFSGHIHGHPNDAGYAYIASKLLGALPQALLAAQPPLHPTPAPALPASAPASQPALT